MRPIFVKMILVLTISILGLQAQANPRGLCAQVLMSDAEEVTVPPSPFEGIKPRARVAQLFKEQFSAAALVRDDKLIELIQRYKNKPDLQIELELVSAFKRSVLLSLEPVLAGFQNLEDFEDAEQEAYVLIFAVIQKGIGATRGSAAVRAEVVRTQLKRLGSDLEELAELRALESLNHRKSIEDLNASAPDRNLTEESLLKGLTDADQKRYLSKLLLRLRPRYEYIVRMYSLHEATYTQVAERMGFSATRSQNLYDQIIQRLKMIAQSERFGSRAVTLPDVMDVQQPPSSRGWGYIEFRREKWRKEFEKRMAELDPSVADQQISAEIILLENELAVLTEIRNGIRAAREMDPEIREQRLTDLEILIREKLILFVLTKEDEAQLSKVQ